MKNKKGITPVIATVLLIAIVVILAFIIFLWARGFTKEAVIKQGENVELACGKVRLEVAYLSDSGDLQITNTGNMPVYRFNVLMTSGGSVNTDERTESLANSQSRVINIGTSYEAISVYPVLLGKTGSGTKTSFVCKNSFEASME